MEKPAENIYSTLFKRPTVELPGFCAHHQLPGQLFGYLNYGGPTASAKDALAEGMLALAYERGVLKPGQPVIEASSGTFAVALTIAAIHSGHPVFLVVPGSVMPERQRMLAELGAKIELTNYVFGRSGMVRRAEELAEEVGGYFVDYFSNDDNPEYHRRVTGPDILKTMDGKIDTLVAGVGSGGSISGIGEYLKGWAGNVWIVAVQPFECQNLTGGYAGQHGISGLGASFVPDNYNPYIVDEVISVSTGDAKAAAREILSTDAVPASVSCGAVLCAAKQVMLQRPGRMLCVFNGVSVYE